MFGFSRTAAPKSAASSEALQALQRHAKSPDTAQAASTLYALAERKFAITHEGTDELDRAIQNLIETLKKNAVDTLASTVKFSMNSSHAMASVSQVAGSTREVDSRVQAMAAATEQLKTSLSQIARTSNDAASTAEHARSAAHQGIERIGQTMISMDEIAGCVDTIGIRTEKLGAASDQISGILETIDAIANQTNLLALNATIEAARAGEHGKGFAVVAGEVKALAAQTSKATEDVRQRIAQLESEISSLKEATAQSIAAAAAGKKEMSEAQVEIARIGSQTDDVSSQMSDISGMLTEQSSAISEIAGGIAQVSALSRNNKEHADKTIDAVRQSETLIEERFAELDRQEIPDAVLFRAKSDHFLWKKRLAEMMVGLNTLKASELSDHHSCRLGKWYDSIKDDRFLNDADFKALIAPHQSVHQFGIKAAQLYASGKIDEAWQAYRKMDEASHDVIRRLDALIEKRRRARS